jgi:Protein of unknown function (DUF1236)
MSNRFMVSVAALALIAGTGFANAQGGMKNDSGAAGGSTMQHSAPADTTAAPSKSDSSSGPAKSESSEPSKGGMKATQSEKSPGAMKNQSAQDNAKEKSGTTSQRAEDNMKSGATKSEGRDRDNMKAEGRDRDNMKAEGRDNTRDNNMKAESRDKSGTNAAETKSTTERSQTTTGQAGAAAKLSTEQRTKITTVIRNEHAAPVNNVNFSIAVGTRVPREGVSFRPLPAEVVTIYPEWRGYEYILVRNQILVIDPGTYEIVAILDA